LDLSRYFISPVSFLFKLDATLFRKKPWNNTWNSFSPKKKKKIWVRNYKTFQEIARVNINNSIGNINHFSLFCNRWLSNWYSKMSDVNYQMVSLGICQQHQIIILVILCHIFFCMNISFRAKKASFVMFCFTSLVWKNLQLSRIACKSLWWSNVPRLISMLPKWRFWCERQRKVLEDQN